MVDEKPKWEKSKNSNYRTRNYMTKRSFIYYQDKNKNKIKIQS